MKSVKFVLALFVLIFLNLMFPSCKNSTEASKNDSQLMAENFVGVWLNQNSNTSGITKVVIRVELDSVFVHMWGKCHPVDCDWEEETTYINDANDNQLNLLWNQGFVIRTQVITYLNDGRLKVDSHSHYIDNSGRQDYDITYFFIKEE